MYKKVCFAHFMLGGSGGMLPLKKFRPLKSLLVHFQVNVHYISHSVNHAAMHRHSQPNLKGGGMPTPPK